MNNCKKCERYAKCKSIIGEAKRHNNFLLALLALKLCPVWQHEMLHQRVRQMKPVEAYVSSETVEAFIQEITGREPK